MNSKIKFKVKKLRLKLLEKAYETKEKRERDQTIQT